jgi:hypothetical protein
MRHSTVEKKRPGFGQHLLAFLWLRWRLRVNQLKRGGIVNIVILAMMAIAAVVASIVMFVACLAIGFFALKNVPPVDLMYVWDGVVVVFLFAWTTGLLSELQRSESLSLEKFLHLPVSLSSAFLINYLSSLASVSLLLFLPAMIGLSLGLVFSRGWSMLLLLPMLASFLLMVTALTYQFQGWLATLMANPRRRRTIIVLTTMIFVLLSQLPNLVNALQPWKKEPKQEPPSHLFQKQDELLRDFSTGKITVGEYKKRQDELSQVEHDHKARIQKEEEERIRQWERTALMMNLIVPPGWLPAGVEAAAEGWPWPVVLALLGPTLIGTASLYRAYRTTLRLYTGQYTSGRSAGAARQVSDRSIRPAPADRRAPRLLEWNLPLLSEQAAAIALATFRSLLRAPEAKMLLLTPIIMLMIFGSMLLTRTGTQEFPEAVRPLLAFGAMVMVLFSMAQLIGNQFGFDRGVFRVFVLSPARRCDILLGKNLALAPIAFTMGAGAAVLVQILYPMRIDHFLALAPRFVSMYLAYCLPANALSILAPMYVPSGTFQRSRPGGIVILLQILFMFVWPLVLTPILLPLGIEWALAELGWLHGVPLDLMLSLLVCAGVILLYHLILHWEGDWLQSREQRILQAVTARAE